MKKNSAFQLRSGNKPSMAKIAGVSPMRDKILQEKKRKDAEFAQKMRDAILKGKITKWNKANPKASQEEYNNWLSGAMKEVNAISDQQALKMGKR
jgi:hypothetical protein